jgi:hypothetical protein
MQHATVRRIKMRRRDDDLHTTRLIGAGWTWECDCGTKGSWESDRANALYWAAQHRMKVHKLR